jgi:8-oxo-dGTP pyrophosphatase MutT (NUDIX family)
MRRPGRPIFVWAIRAGIWIAAEGRVKYDLMISRMDTSSVLLFHRNGELLDTEIVLVRECRVSAATRDGYVWELPSGSSHNPAEDALSVALKELEEETGLGLARARLKTHECRQLMATLSAHKSLLFVGEISADEMVALKAEAGKAHGVMEDGERTFVEIRTLREIITDSLVDWSTLGMIHSGLLRDFSSAANLTYRFVP